jgi:hypothetical protein
MTKLVGKICSSVIHNKRNSCRANEKVLIFKTSSRTQTFAQQVVRSRNTKH